MYPIYGSGLRDDKFRLLCLTAPAGPEDPIHVTLTTYPDDDCPEYETTSYAWGGEDGKSAKTRPVYVGDCWDVLLQTANCWSLLKYLRPRRGIRMVWVDAICINQEDDAERGRQVVEMVTIYKRSSRVVVYLGIEIVSNTSAGRNHPRRHSLHKFQRRDFISGQS